MPEEKETPKKLTAKELMDRARALENKLEPGASSRLPKEQLLTADEAVAKNPDSYLRFVGMADPQNVEVAQNEGFVRLSSEEGGKQIGNQLVLMAQPKHIHEAEVARSEKLNSDLLVAHKKGMREAAESAARTLRDQHGIRVDPERLYVDE